MMSFFRTTVAILLALPMLFLVFYFLQDIPSANFTGVEMKVGDKLISIKSESLSSTSTTTTTSTSSGSTTGTAGTTIAAEDTTMMMNTNKTKDTVTGSTASQQSMAIPQAATTKLAQKRKKRKKKNPKNNNAKQKQKQKPSPSPSPSPRPPPSRQPLAESTPPPAEATTMTADKIVPKQVADSISGGQEENNNNNNNNKNDGDEKKKKPIILVGTHHKTGTVLAQGVFKRIAKSAKLQYKKFAEVKIDKNNPTNLLDQLRGVDVAFDYDWALTLKDLQRLSSVIGRPYKLVHFTRHPLAIPVSAYSYHQRGSEYWLHEPKMLVFNERGGGGPIRSKWCNNWEERCQDYGEYIPDLCQKDKAAAIDQLNCNEYDLLKEELSKSDVTQNSTFWNISHYDVVHKLNRLDGVRFESVYAVGQQLDMAAVVESTKNDPNTLTVDLDTVVKNHKQSWTKIISFVGLDPAKYLKYTMKYEISHATTNHAKHITRNENKTDIEAEVRKALVQQAYQPMISIMDHLGVNSIANPAAVTTTKTDQEQRSITTEQKHQPLPSPHSPPSMPPATTQTLKDQTTVADNIPIQQGQNTNMNKIIDQEQKPIILIGTHHKTGTVLAQKVFRDIGKAAKLRYKKLGGRSLKKANLLDQLRGVDIVVDTHWELTWKDLQQLTNAGRPYKFVHFTRHPLEISVSAYSYHLKGPESWLFKKKKIPLNQGNGTIQSTWCNRGKQMCQKYGEYIPDLCDESKGGLIDQLLCHEYNILAKEVRNSSFTKKKSSVMEISTYHALQRLNRLDGVRFQAAESAGEMVGMAAVVESTKNDPNTLTVDLDIVVKNHKLCWSQILSFVGLDPTKYLRLTNKYDVSRMSKSDTHITRNENKTDIQEEVKKPLVQNAYQPMISIMDQLDMTCHY